MRVPYLIPSAVAGFVICLTASAQQPGPALSINLSAGRHAISPDIYGIDFLLVI